jgi:hypothetical protein
MSWRASVPSSDGDASEPSWRSSAPQEAAAPARQAAGSGANPPRTRVEVLLELDSNPTPLKALPVRKRSPLLPDALLSPFMSSAELSAAVGRLKVKDRVHSHLVGVGNARDLGGLPARTHDDVPGTSACISLCAA